MLGGFWFSLRAQKTDPKDHIIIRVLLWYIVDGVEKIVYGI